MLNTQLGPYRILRQIAETSSGETFEAVDRTYNKKVILRYFRPGSVSQEILSRLHSEAKTLALLTHPNIARVFGFIRREDQLYLVTEFFEGHTLEDILAERGRMPPAMAVALFRQFLAGVVFAHRLGVVHGHLKPSNILVPNFGPIKLLDFGVAHLLRNLDRPGTDGSTSRYMSPEQIGGNSPDVRSDVYSLGMVLYELMVGKGPFDVYGSTVDAGVLRERGELIPAQPSLSGAEIPKWLDGFLLRALATVPAERFQSVRAMAHALDLAIVPHPAKVPLKNVRLWCRRFANSLALAPSTRVVAARQRAVTSIRTSVSEMRAELSKAPVLLDALKSPAKGMRATAERIVHRVASASTHFFASSKRQLEFFDRVFRQTSRVDFRRYIHVASLLALISVECFYFRGANISLILDSKLMARPSLSDEVDAMFARLNKETPKTERRELTEKDSAPVEDRQYASREFPAKPIISANIGTRPEPINRLPVDSARRSPSIAPNSEKETNAAPVHVPSANVPNGNEPVKTAQHHSFKSELKVKWEN